MPKGFSGIQYIEGFPEDYFSRENLEKKLKMLKESPVPAREPRIMCFSMRADFEPSPPDPLYTIDYICPVCGTKTIHRVENWSPLYRLDKIRDATQEVRQLGLEIYFEERQFCNICSKDLPTNNALQITIDNRTFHVPTMSPESDCDLLKSFLSAKTKPDFDKLMKEIDGDTYMIENLLGVKDD